MQPNKRLTKKIVNRTRFVKYSKKEVLHLLKLLIVIFLSCKYLNLFVSVTLNFPDIIIFYQYALLHGRSFFYLLFVFVLFLFYLVVFLPSENHHCDCLWCFLVGGIVESWIIFVVWVGDHHIEFFTFSGFFTL